MIRLLENLSTYSGDVARLVNMPRCCQKLIELRSVSISFQFDFLPSDKLVQRERHASEKMMSSPTALVIQFLDDVIVLIILAEWFSVPLIP